MQADGQNASVAPPTNMAFPLLSALLNVAVALDRNQEAAQVRCTNCFPPVAAFSTSRVALGDIQGWQSHLLDMHCSHC